MSKTEGSPRHKKGEELVHRFRAMLLRSMDIMDERGKTLAELVAEAAIANPLTFIEKASKYLPKDLNVKHEQEGLAELIAALQRLRSQASVSTSVVQRSDDTGLEQTSVTH